MTLKLTKTRERQATRHVISLMKVSMCLSQFSVADTLNPEPEYICAKDPEELIRLFYQSLVQRTLLIKDDVEERYMPSDLDSLPGKQQELIKQWCSQVPVIDFNSGKYDLQLIRKVLYHPSWARKHLVRRETGSNHVHEHTLVQVSRHHKLSGTWNYLCYDKWVKTYGANQTKSWLPYKWFDTADKLDYKGLPPYWCWYSQLRNRFALTPKEYEECKRVL